MKIGIMSFNTEYTMRADRLASAAEERGYESLWVPEHTHIPVPIDDGDPETGMPRMPDGSFLPVEYRHMSDPFTSLAAAASVTKKLMLGTCVCLVNQHHPINLAKHVSTLDQLSDGRFIFGVGAGWNVQEMGHHGIEFEDRWRQVRERLAALRTLWAEERPAFKGDYVQFEESWQFPKPVQPGGPRIVLGTLDTPFGRKQVAEHGDGWLPLTFNIDQTKKSIEEVHAQMTELGRDPDTLEVSTFFVEDVVQPSEVISQARDAGVARTILRLPAAPEADVLRVLDQYAKDL